MSGRPVFTDEERAVAYAACERYARLRADSLKDGIEVIEREHPLPGDDRAGLVKYAALDAQEWERAELLLVKPVADYTDEEVASLQNALEVMVEYFTEDELSAEYDDDGNLVMAQSEFSTPSVDECAGMEPEEFGVYLERLNSACEKTSACTNIPYQFGRIGV